LGRALLAVFIAILALGCSNNPYPEADDREKVLYLPYTQPPKTLDPAVSYGTADTVVTNKVFDTLLEYHYFKRPYELLPSMAKQIPEAEELEDGRVRYVFQLRPHLRFQPDPCFQLSGREKAASEGRPVEAEDFVFEFLRIADPKTSSPVIEPFANLDGFREFREALTARRKADKGFESLSLRDQYEKLGGLKGAVAADASTLTITLKAAYPQILYWLAMPVSTPVAWEAVAYYNGKDGHSPFSEHPVSTGSYRVSTYDKQARMVLERNPDWWGLKNPDAPGVRFPDVPAGTEWDDLREAEGKALPFLDRIEYRREVEAIPQFSKFLQGYYDFSGINRESFDKVVQEGGLSPEMKSLGMRLTKGIDPTVSYIGFNMDDATVGREAGKRSRLLRQAMSLVIDVNEYLRLFRNGRGQPAHTPIPPGLFGYEEGYKNPFRKVDLPRARALLKEAGYEGGIDPKTKKPLRLSFDVADTSPEGRVRYMFWVNQWRKLGINVELAATNYNQFYEKMLKGSYQLYPWGWSADYPDPENFLFLLHGDMARSKSGGPNNTNFQNKEYDALFSKMRTRQNDEERLRIIREMRSILETERPWIELFYPAAYTLSHSWVSNVRSAGLTTITTAKYYDVDPKLRAKERALWNQPVLWPAFLLLALFLLILAPGVYTYYQERT